MKDRASKFELSIVCVGIALSACGNTTPIETVMSPAAQAPVPSSAAGASATPAPAKAGAGAVTPPASAGAPAISTPAVSTPTPAASGGAGAAAPIAAAAGAGAIAGSGSTAGAGVVGAAGASAAGSSAAAGSGGAAGAMASVSYPDCKSEEVGPCGTFITQGGMKIPLGSYGALMDRNVGKGSEVKVASGDSDGGAQCASVVASFGEDAEESKPLQDVKGIDFALFTVYRPAKWSEGEKFPVISWGNGTCAKPEGYGALLRYVASHGFVVIAANSRWVGSNSAMIRALDFAEAANADATSPYYKHLDLEKIGAMGHSQGGMATVSAASDKRIKTVIIWNGGSSAVKTFLAVTGDKDIGNPTVASLKRAVDGDPPGAWLFYHKTIGTGSVPGHLTLMKQPERVIEPTVAWFKYQLLNDMPSKAWFVGTDCKLCKTTDDYEYGQMSLP